MAMSRAFRWQFATCCLPEMETCADCSIHSMSSHTQSTTSENVSRTLDLMETGNSAGRSDGPESERELADLRALADQPWSDLPPKRSTKKKTRPRPRDYRRPQSRTPGGLRRESRDRQAVELRSQGLKFDEIATKLG